MNEGRTHFADDATLKYMAALEVRVQLLAKALRDLREELAGSVHERSKAIRDIDAALREAGLDKESE